MGGRQKEISGQTASVELGLLLRQGTAFLSQAGVEAPGYDAGALLEQITGRQRLLLYGSREPCPPEQQESFWRLLQRRATGEPLQYILGEWDFYGRTFKVGDGVLIPRSDTEALIEAVLKLPLPSRPLVADLCSGSGCIGITLGLELAGSQVWMVEKSPQALDYLRDNIQRHSRIRQSGAASPAPFEALEGDVLLGGRALEQARFYGEIPLLDLLVSNPPYILRSLLPQLQREVQFEPAMALDGGPDGLDFYRAIAQNWREKLRPGGWLALEIGYDQGKTVPALLEQQGYTCVQLHRDLSGNDRCVTARRPEK